MRWEDPGPARSWARCVSPTTPISRLNHFRARKPPSATVDVILLELEWYRLGDEASERQWNDILGVLKVQGDQLDQGYLDHWAVELQVKDLLDRARQEAAL